MATLDGVASTTAAAIVNGTTAAQPALPQAALEAVFLLASVPAVFFIFAGPVRLRQIFLRLKEQVINEYAHCRLGLKYAKRDGLDVAFARFRAKIIVSILAAVAYSTRLGLLFYYQSVDLAMVPPATLWYHAVDCGTNTAAWVLSALVVYFEFQCLQRQNWMQISFWWTATLLNVVALVASSMVLDAVREGAYLVGDLLSRFCLLVPLTIMAILAVFPRDIDKETIQRMRLIVRSYVAAGDDEAAADDDGLGDFRNSNPYSMLDGQAGKRGSGAYDHGEEGEYDSVEYRPGGHSPRMQGGDGDDDAYTGPSFGDDLTRGSSAALLDVAGPAASAFDSGRRRSKAGSSSTNAPPPNRGAALFTSNTAAATQGKGRVSSLIASFDDDDDDDGGGGGDDDHNDGGHSGGGRIAADGESKPGRSNGGGSRAMGIGGEGSAVGNGRANGNNHNDDDDNSSHNQNNNNNNPNSSSSSSSSSNNNTGTTNKQDGPPNRSRPETGAGFRNGQHRDQRGGNGDVQSQQRSRTTETNGDGGAVRSAVRGAVRGAGSNSSSSVAGIGADDEDARWTKATRSQGDATSDVISQLARLRREGSDDALSSRGGGITIPQTSRARMTGHGFRAAGTTSTSGDDDFGGGGSGDDSDFTTTANYSSSFDSASGSGVRGVRSRPHAMSSSYVPRNDPTHDLLSLVRGQATSGASPGGGDGSHGSSRVRSTSFGHRTAEGGGGMSSSVGSSGSQDNNHSTSRPRGGSGLQGLYATSTSGEEQRWAANRRKATSLQVPTSRDLREAPATTAAAAADGDAGGFRSRRSAPAHGAGGGEARGTGTSSSRTGTGVGAGVGTGAPAALSSRLPSAETANISIAGSEERSGSDSSGGGDGGGGGGGGSSSSSRKFTVFKIVVTNTETGAMWVVWKRYSDFASFDKRLREVLKQRPGGERAAAALSPLPKKANALKRGGALSTRALQERMFGLQAFLRSADFADITTPLPPSSKRQSIELLRPFLDLETAERLQL
jgi:hypothetical protein